MVVEEPADRFGGGGQVPGVDEHHPAQTGREIAALAPAARLLEPWKDPGHLPAATEAVGRFLRDHTPR